MNGNEISLFIVGILIFIGALISFISAIGVVRFPDVYTRSHAATKSATFSVLCVLTGVFLYFAFVEGYVSARVLLGIVFIFLTAPVGGHLMIRAAHYSGVQLSKESIRDELQEKKDKERTKTS